MVVPTNTICLAQYRTGGNFHAIPDFALFRKFRGY